MHIAIKRDLYYLAEMGDKKLLVIGHVWPEPTSSAAGWRMLQLLDLFSQHQYSIHFASAASRSAHSHPLAPQGIQEHDIKLNDSSFDNFVKQLQPVIVLFDRFMVEEQYGWRVAENAPNALRILDTEDLHFLRAARQEAFRKNIPWHDSLLYSELAKREIASILRSDLSMIISKEEYILLKEKFGISEKLMYLLPFLSAKSNTESDSSRSYSERRHFVFIGNFLHEPNWQTVRLLKTVYWPLIRKRLPEAELHIYGAYPSQKVLSLHQPKEKFHIKGRAEDAVSTLAQYRVLIAPIPFGAGLKGKFVDSWQAGTPSVTTTVGAEGFESTDWSGCIENETALFIEKSVTLYQDENIWQNAQQKTRLSLAENTISEKVSSLLIQQIEMVTEDIHTHRQNNFLGQILQSQQFSATRYMSLWIEEKHKNKINKP